ncbi:MAG: hypothetical protein IIW20_04945 [Clostridia bacterium]|nr:hypothetical protein [Clostridia bacterium]
MEEIVYNGKKYIRNNAKWTDTDYMVVHEKLQIELNKLYLQTLDISGYSVEELVSEGDKFKNSATYDYAIVFYEKAIETCDEQTLKYILPRITSCYRHEGVPRKAIKLFSFAKSTYGVEFLSGPLLTSVAAAFCDLKEYENALRCCKWAYKAFNGEFNSSLNNVFARIKKESGLTE